MDATENAEIVLYVVSLINSVLLLEENLRSQ